MQLVYWLNVAQIVGKYQWQQTSLLYYKIPKRVRKWSYYVIKSICNETLIVYKSTTVCIHFCFSWLFKMWLLAFLSWYCANLTNCWKYLRQMGLFLPISYTPWHPTVNCFFVVKIFSSTKMHENDFHKDNYTTYIRTIVYT